MRLSEQTANETLRLRLAQGLMLGVLLFLGGALWRVQVLHTTKYRSSLERQSIRRVRLPGVRGRILDRAGRCLADNRPSYCIAIYVEELRQSGRWGRTVDEVERLIDELAALIGVRRQVSRDAIMRHIVRRLPLPFVAWRDLGEAALARWAESPRHFPGVDIYVEPVRVYPHGRGAAHALGFVGRADPQASEEGEYDFYLPEMEGRSGVEYTFNDDLAGKAGGRLLRVDASGFKHEEKVERDPLWGRDLWLTLDMRIQGVVEEALGDVRGACVVLDPNNGDVLAMVSAPAFNPNLRVSHRAWRRYSEDARKPLFNRALTGTYAPGSIFKPVVAVAALENRVAAGTTRYPCPGYFEIGGVRFHCWSRSGHGTIDMRKAIEQSCNAYFCQLGLACNHQRIYHMAAALGLGHATGIELEGEASGLLPDEAWKVRYRHDQWRSGDTCNLSIGQGALAATPLQMAVVASTFANAGTVYRPRLLLRTALHNAEPNGLVLSPPGVVLNRMGWSAETVRVIHDGMVDVVNAPSGTGKRARVPGVRVAGKTGTAEYGPRSRRRKYAWMMAFAPAERPAYALALVVEDGVSGGITAAPRVSQVLAGVMGVELPAAPGADEPAGTHADNAAGEVDA